MTTATETTRPTDFADLRAWLRGADLDKAAGTLPEKDDGGGAATTGARGAEYSSDLKKTVPANDVESGAKNPADGKTDSPVPESGLQQTSTGKMPDVERAVKTVTEETDKIAAADLTTDAGFAAGFDALQKAAAALPVLFAAGAPTAPAPPAPAPVQTPAEKPAADAAAEKAAADEAAIRAEVAQFVKFGEDRAELVTRYLDGYWQTLVTLQKAAADGSMDAMMAAGPPGGDVPPPADPGAPPAGPPDAPPGGDAGGPPSVDDLAAALAEMGVTPDMLMEVAQKMQGEVAAPDAGGTPDEKEKAASALAETVKAAGDAKALMRAGRFQLKPAADGTPDRARREVAKAYIQELFRLGQV